MIVFLNPHYRVNPEEFQELRSQVELLKAEVQAIKAASTRTDVPPDRK